VNGTFGSYESSSPPPSPSSSALVSGFFGEIVDKPEGKLPVPKTDVRLLIPNTNGPKKEIKFW
jgi:hypothetical protein